LKKLSLGQTITILANTGVIAGIAFLTIEINQANKLAETQAHVFRLDQMQEASVTTAESEYLPEIELKVRSEGVQSLSPSEHYRLQNWEASVVSRMQGHYYQYQQGYLNKETGDQILSAAASSLELWNQLGVVIVDQEFRRLVEAAASGDPD
jgi:hypothetical protein